MLAKRVFNLREGWQPRRRLAAGAAADPAAGDRLGPGRGADAGAAARHDRRLLRRARAGLAGGRPAPADLADLGVEVGPERDRYCPLWSSRRLRGRSRSTIDGQQVTVPDGTTIWTAAKAAGIDIPVLCHDERYDPVGVCRMCVVDTGGRAYAAACVRPCEDGMEVKTATPDVERSRATLTELLLADQPPPAATPSRPPPATTSCSPWPTGTGSPARAACRCGSGRGTDTSNPVIAVDHDACILCDRCVRACDDIQGNDVIGRTGKGYATRIAFDLNDPMGEVVLRHLR